MYTLIGKTKIRCFFSTTLNRKTVTCPFIEEYSKYLFKRKKFGTAKQHISSIHKFWMYSLYFPIKDSESFIDYFEDYLDVLHNKGFEILKEYKDDITGVKHYIKLKSYKKMSDPSIEISRIKYYFMRILNPLTNKKYELIDDNYLIVKKDKNIKLATKKAKYSRGSSYGLHPKGIMKRTLSDYNTIFDEIKYNVELEYKTKKAFPYEFFERLLSMSSRREKLLYLLCGATSARVSQALSLTIFDLDFKNKRVCLINPRSNNFAIDKYHNTLNNQMGRRDLLLKYNIDFRVGKYRRIGFKYPIPTINDKDGSLYFLIPKYRKMFFDIYLKYIDEIETKNYPMVFQTTSLNSDNILLPSNVADSFKRKIYKLIEIYPEQASLLEGCSIHSLRHMFGQSMARIAYTLRLVMPNGGEIKMPDNEIVNIVEIFKLITAKKMGHTDISSVLTYFNVGEEMEELTVVLREKYNNDIKSIEDYLSLNIRKSI